MDNDVRQLGKILSFLQGCRFLTCDCEQRNETDTGDLFCRSQLNPSDRLLLRGARDTPQRPIRDPKIGDGFHVWGGRPDSGEKATAIARPPRSSPASVKELAGVSAHGGTWLGAPLPGNGGGLLP